MPDNPVQSLDPTTAQPSEGPDPTTSVNTSASNIPSTLLGNEPSEPSINPTSAGTEPPTFAESSMLPSSDTTPTPPPLSADDQTTAPPPTVPPPAPRSSKAKVVGAILGLFILAISVPIGVILVRQAQEIRERAEGVFECSREEADTGSRTQSCDAGNACTGTQYSEYDSCEDTDNNGECDKFFCHWSSCTEPITCPVGCTNPTGSEGDRIRADPYCIPGETCSYDSSVGVGMARECKDGNWVDSPECSWECPAPSGLTWSQCSVTDGPEPKLPCGSCSVTNVGAGTMSFSCELDCGGSASKCPGGSAGSYSIVHRWESCKNKGSEACTGSSSDYIESGDLGGPGPWTISGQSVVNGSGTFPAPGCGRVQVDVQMSAEGTDVAAKIYDTGRDCVEPPPPPPPPSDGEEISAECKNIKAYDANWRQLTADALVRLKAGDGIRFAVGGSASSGTFDKAQFRVNSGVWQETTAKNPNGEFYITYQVPPATTTFKIEAQVHHKELNQWF